jgi:hypothetical protein
MTEKLPMSLCARAILLKQHHLQNLLLSPSSLAHNKLCLFKPHQTNKICCGQEQMATVIFYEIEIDKSKVALSNQQ